MQPFIISIAFIFFVCYAALIIYYAFSWRSIPVYKPPTANHQSIIFSIIIPARNEEENIKNCLESILKQSYPKELYEVIVINDHSTDQTAVIVQQYASANIKLISLKEEMKGQAINSYKKRAIEIAIAQSTGEFIITTDADCIVPPNWLQTIALFQQKTNAVFIAMPVKYTCNNSPLEIFQALDFMTLQGITGASVYKRSHSMCNGANLAYSKKIFNEVNGFTGIDNIASGDDMLLMHKIYKAQPDNVFFLKSTEVIVQTQPMKTLKDFINQRIRWASKADKYDDKRIFAVLLLVYLFNVMMLLLPFISLYSNFQCSILNAQFSMLSCWIFLLIIKTSVELFFLFPVAKFFKQQKLLWWFPVAQPFHITYTVIAGWLGKFGSYQWKERNVK